MKKVARIIYNLNNKNIKISLLNTVFYNIQNMPNLKTTTGKLIKTFCLKEN